MILEYKETYVCPNCGNNEFVSQGNANTETRHWFDDSGHYYYETEIVKTINGEKPSCTECGNRIYPEDETIPLSVYEEGLTLKPPASGPVFFYMVETLREPLFFRYRSAAIAYVAHANEHGKTDYKFKISKALFFYDTESDSFYRLHENYVAHPSFERGSPNGEG